jgi:hypothetical protein
VNRIDKSIHDRRTPVNARFFVSPDDFQDACAADGMAGLLLLTMKLAWPVSNHGTKVLLVKSGRR